MVLRLRFWRIRKSSIETRIETEEILLDSMNPAKFDRDRFEGRIERRLGSRTFYGAAIVVGLLFLALSVQAFSLQIIQGDKFAARAKNNQIDTQTIVADRGTITDRNGIPLAYNSKENLSDLFAKRVYTDYRGIAHVVGYVNAPAADKSGVYFRTNYEGIAGSEKVYDSLLKGKNGARLVETNAQGEVVSDAFAEQPQTGARVTLSIDAALTQELYDAIKEVANLSGFKGGAGVIMDVHTGEIVALTSYPEYSSQKMADADSAALKAYNADPEHPFIDRAVDGLYAPGSIVKPYVALGALTEGVITENTQIESTGQISIPNVYNPSNPTIFRDWRVQGWMDIRHAIAYSSDVFFYEIGGGFGSQKGLGIANLDKYFSMFGFTKDPGLAGFSDESGTIPSPTWKAKNFPDDPTWRIGNTYHTAIGQYGMQVSPLQAVRAIAAVANNGTLLTPTLIASSTPQGTKLDIDPYYFQIVHEGMRLGVTDPRGTVQALNLPFVKVAGKTGTAQLGNHNEYMNSWAQGFFPYDDPKYAFAIVLEHSPAGTLQGSPLAMNKVFYWMQEHAPQYLK